MTLPLWLVGHSLGAAEAADAAALAVLEGIVPERVVLAGEPKPGWAKLAEVCRRVPNANWRSYRNDSGGPAAELRHDLVTDAPPLPGYGHRGPQVPIDAPPGSQHFSELDLFAWHHVQLYLAGCPDADRDAMEWVAKIYDRSRDAEWDWVGDVAGVFMALKRFPGTADLACFRGSVTLRDWARDAFAPAVPLDGGALGPIHAGFFLGVPEAFARIKEFSAS